MSCSDDLNTVTEHEDPYRGGDEIISMYEGVGHQLLEDDSRDLRNAYRVDRLLSLYLKDMCQDEAHCLAEDVPHLALDVATIDVRIHREGSSGECTGFDNEL